MQSKKSYINKKDPLWRSFEQAVASFVSSLDPSASVTHDAHVPDNDTGALRQRDVWVEGKLCGLFPIKVLISCKRLKRPLNESDIDHFLGELSSSNAHKGVIYSYSGFNNLAIKKAKIRGISCMRLYQDEPPEIPEVLIIPHAYFCYPRFVLDLLWKHDPHEHLQKWSDIFNRPAGETDPNQKVIEFISNEFSKWQKLAMQKAGSVGNLPQDWMTECTFVDNDNPDIRARIRFAESWRIFEAKVEAYNVNGSYSFTEKEFVGGIGTPSIDTWGSMPGPGWTELAKRPSEKGSHMTLILTFGDIRDILINYFGPRKLKPMSQIEKGSSKQCAH